MKVTARPPSQPSCPLLATKAVFVMPPHDPEPTQAAALIVNTAGQYLLHLRDNKPGLIACPGMWSLIGGQRESDESLKETIARELDQEIGLTVQDLTPFTISTRTAPDGTTQDAVHVFLGHWDGDASALPLTEGVMCYWATAEVAKRLVLDPGTAAVIDEHQGRALADAFPVAAVPPKASGRFGAPIDVHAVLLRPGATGWEVLLTRRAGNVYATGLWHMPSGHIDGGHEDVVEALVREAAEETGVAIAPADVQIATVMHHRSPQGSVRMGAFGVVRTWTGEPHIREPHLCNEMAWFPLERLPSGMVAYAHAGLAALRAGQHFAVHFQQPNDPIAHAADGPNRLQPLPAFNSAALRGPSTALWAFAEQAIGPIAGVEDSSWRRATSRVWKVTGKSGGTWYLKRHQSEKFHTREVLAYREWVPHLGERAPRLVAADDRLLAVVLTELPGRNLHGLTMAPVDERHVHQQLGEIARIFHDSAPALPHEPLPISRTQKVNRHLEAARPLLSSADEDLVRQLAMRYDSLPPGERVPTLGDLQLRNALLTDTGTVGVFDFERAEARQRGHDFVRLADLWDGRDDLRAAFITGYGRPLTRLETAHMECEEALDALSGIAYGLTHDDPEVVERGRRTLRRLHRSRTA
jgi:8-oxo-dGTP pyrophosphatase MutT (NUDIX family)